MVLKYKVEKCKLKMELKKKNSVGKISPCLIYSRLPHRRNFFHCWLFLSCMFFHFLPMWRIPKSHCEQLESVHRHRCALGSTVISRQQGCVFDFDVESRHQWSYWTLCWSRDWVALNPWQTSLKSWLNLFFSAWKYFISPRCGTAAGRKTIFMLGSKQYYFQYQLKSLSITYQALWTGSSIVLNMFHCFLQRTNHRLKFPITSDHSYEFHAHFDC